MKKLIKFFDKLEDGIRGSLSRRPILYTFIGGVGIVMFWKGVWETAALFPVLDGPASMVVGVLVLLLTGLFVSFFIGDQLIITGIKREKKLAEKTEEEVRKESVTLNEIKRQLEKVNTNVRGLKREVSASKKSSPK